MEDNENEKIEYLIKKMGSYKADLKNDALELFESFGYFTKRRIDALDSPVKFLEAFPNFSKVKGHWSEWEQYYFLFQITNEDLGKILQENRIARLTASDEAMMFMAIKLKVSLCTDTTLKQIAAEINKQIYNPSIILFSFGKYLCFVYTPHRINKNDNTKDVLEPIRVFRVTPQNFTPIQLTGLCSAFSIKQVYGNEQNEKKDETYYSNSSNLQNITTVKAQEPEQNIDDAELSIAEEPEELDNFAVVSAEDNTVEEKDEDESLTTQIEIKSEETNIVSKSLDNQKELFYVPEYINLKSYNNKQKDSNNDDSDEDDDSMSDVDENLNEVSFKQFNENFVQIIKEYKSRYVVNEENELEEKLIEDDLFHYLTEIGKIPLLSHAEEKKLTRMLAEGDNKQKEYAKRKLIQSNLRLVIFVAKKFIYKKRLQFMDLIQAGNIGLIRSTEKFDYEKGYRFSTYAYWWIRQSISRSIQDTGKTIRYPVHYHEKLHKLFEYIDSFREHPSYAQIAAHFNLPMDKVVEMVESPRCSLSLETLNEDYEDEEVNYYNKEYKYLEDKNTENVDSIENDLLKESIVEVLATLSPRERDVIIRRFGLDDGKPRTLEEVGQIYGVTRERIRQIEAKALRKLRHPNRTRMLKTYQNELQ